MRPATTEATPPDTCCSEELMDMYEPRSEGAGRADMSAEAEIIREKMTICRKTMTMTRAHRGVEWRCVYITTITMVIAQPKPNTLNFPRASLARPMSGPHTM